MPSIRIHGFTYFLRKGGSNLGKPGTPIKITYPDSESGICELTAEVLRPRGDLQPLTGRAGRAVRSRLPAGRRAGLRVGGLVGWQNLGKMLLVFGCIGTDFCNKYAFCSIFQNLPDFLAEFF